jgi:hypothetical protein
MKPPKPTKYKHGDLHESTGRIFMGYCFRRGVWYERLYKSTTKEGAHIEIMFKNAIQRARRDEIPFDIDIEFLESIKTETCPILGMKLSWGSLGDAYVKNNSPSLDKIIPEYGYIKGNVCIISYLANKIKQDVGYDTLYKIADWLHDKTKEVKQNVTPEQLASLPKRSNRPSRKDTQLGTLLTAGSGQDCDYANPHCGTVQGQNPYYRAKTGCGDCVGCRGKEVGSPQASFVFEDYGDAEPEIIRLDFGSGYLLGKP